MYIYIFFVFMIYYKYLPIYIYDIYVCVLDFDGRTNYSTNN